MTSKSELKKMGYSWECAGCGRYRHKKDQQFGDIKEPRCMWCFMSNDGADLDDSDILLSEIPTPMPNPPPRTLATGHQLISFDHIPWGPPSQFDLSQRVAALERTVAHLRRKLGEASQ